MIFINISSFLAWMFVLGGLKEKGSKGHENPPGAKIGASSGNSFS